jgi:hypothetical protein
MRVLRRSLLGGLIVGALASGTSMIAAPQTQEARQSRIAGTVVDAVSQEPISGARVTAYRDGTDLAGSATTGGEGEFELSGLPAGRYELHVFHSLYVPESGLRSDMPPPRFDLRADLPMTGVVLRLPRRPVLSGTVRDETGEPLVHVEVAAFRRLPAGAGADPDATGRTDNRGMYRLVLSGRASEYLILVRGSSQVPLRPGQLQAEASLSYPSVYYPAAPRLSGASAVAIGLNEERTGIDFTLTPLRGVSVAARLTGGEAASGLLDVHLLPVDGTVVQWDSPVGTVRIPPEVRFAFSNVPRGTYVLWAVNFPRHAGRLTPTIRRSGSSGFAGNASIAGPGATPMGLPPDGDTLWARHAVVVEDDDVHLTVPLGRGSRVSGRVTFEGASPKPTPETLTHSAVLVFATDGAQLGSVPVSGLAADGSFRTVAVPPGAYEILLFLNSPAWRLRSVTVGGRDVTSRPIPIGSDDITDLVYTFSDRKTSVSGVLRDPSTRTVEGGSVAVFPTDRTFWGPRLFLSPIGSARSGADGAFEVVLRGAGEYYVTSVPRGLADQLQDPAVLDQLSRTARVVRVSEGQSTRVDVTAAEPRASR